MVQMSLAFNIKESFGPVSSFQARELMAPTIGRTVEPSL